MPKLFLAASERQEVCSMELWMVLSVFVVSWLLVWCLSRVARYLQQNNFQIPVRDASKGRHYIYVQGGAKGVVHPPGNDPVRYPPPFDFQRL